MKWLVREKSFYTSLFLIAVPLIVQNLLSSGVSLVDNVMVGQLGERAVAGVMVALQVQNILNMILLGISSSIVLLAAQYWGRREPESVKMVASIGIKTGMAIGFLLSLTVLIMPRTVLGLFTNEAAVIDSGFEYIRIVAFSYVFFCITQTLMATMRCVEVVRIAMLVSLSTLCLSVALNYILIFGKLGFPAFGISGAAISTLISRIIEAAIMVVYVRRIDKRLKIRFVQLLKTNRKLLADFFRHGTPVILGDILWGLAGTLHIAIMGRMGEAAMAANSISNVMFQVVTVIVFSCAGASGVIIGKTVGSGKYDLVKQYARTLQLLFLGIALTTSAIFFCLRDVFISFYDFSLDTQAIARQFMTIMSISIIGTGYHAPSFTGIIRAGGDTKFVLIVDFICAWLIVLPSAYLAAFVFAQPPWIVFLCLRSDQFFKWIVAIIKTNSFTWIKNLTRDNLETAGQTAQKAKRVGD